MRAVIYSENGPSSVLSVVDRPDPEPGPGEVRVRVLRSGINPTDWKFRSRFPQPYDEIVPGQDGAGLVDAVGEGVDEFSVGDRVWLVLAQHGRAHGTAADHTVQPVERVFALPAGADFDLGASLGVPAITAHRALTCAQDGPTRLAPGALTDHVVLVAGGAGAVGNAAIQLARWAGATVITTVSGDEKAALATTAGAHHVVNYRTTDAAAEIRTIAPGGVDLVVEVAPAQNNALDLAVLRNHGTVAIYADNGGGTLAAPLLPAMWLNVRYQFVLLYPLDPELLRAAAEDVNAAVACGALRVGEQAGLPLHHFPLEQTAVAHDAVEAGAIGKVLVDVSEPEQRDVPAATPFSTTPTAYAVSPDSGRHWADEGAWPVAPGIHRIPLPLPSDVLKAVNVYAIETPSGLTLVDGGWAIKDAREVLERSLGLIGAGFGDIDRFLVTHVHRDHYSLAAEIGEEYGADVALGADEKATLDLLNDQGRPREETPFFASLVSAGAEDLARQWNNLHGAVPAQTEWRYPDTWLEGDHAIAVGARTLDAVHTPGHTAGHYVFAEKSAALLFAGDHVLPTITPSIGFTQPPAPDPLGDFMASLTKVRALPDLRLLPAHGPVAPSTHARIDELLAHHEVRLTKSLATLLARPLTAFEAAHQLGWTRHERSFDELDQFNQGIAAMETKAHLELLVARGLATRAISPEGVVLFTHTGRGAAR
ncbi:MBL fold metallo-hydrolase [Nocardioides cavernaquae]|uniref:MBL fold metallo-hydrolase n=1 Tax=Nocardioides cavernaquae TaxID=2321396 RepID=UPI001EE58410|nr:MBL fold metallo-hydrolase [Nocardioides cavernaquae]